MNRMSDSGISSVNNRSMILKIAVLVAAVLQVVGAAYLSIGTFEETERALPVFIQPAGWAFSIWGLIYVFSFMYAVYQIIPKYDNALLAKTRVPALVGFLGSIAWLFFAGMNNWLVWLTIPILFTMALFYTRVVSASDSYNTFQTIFSKRLLLPYAAWTGIASWLNIQALLNERSIINSETINYVSNGILFVCIALFTFYYYRKSNYSAWYGGVLVWAGIGVLFANLNNGSMVFTVLGGVFSLIALMLFVKKQWF